MKGRSLLLFLFLFCQKSNANIRDSVITYPLPDSIRAVQLITEVSVQSVEPKKWFELGLTTDIARVAMFGRGKYRGFFLSVSATLNNLQRGLNIGFNLKDHHIIFDYNWQIGESYKLLISQATDSASGLTVCSGYVFLPREGKWKFIGSGTINRWHPSLLNPTLRYTGHKKQNLLFRQGPAWAQRSSGSWRLLSDNKTTPPVPVINLSGHLDSIQQRQKEIKIITDSIALGKTDAKQEEQGVYYHIINPGTGRRISVEDTVSVFYKGYLFSNGQVFDQTGEKPASFQLKRLIRAWQIAVPLLKVGGKIKMVIPSDMAYSIRTRAAKIPPNSTLVFEVEVIEARSPEK